LIYDETSKFYEAPFQMKANGGIFMVDDFGRQRVSPKDLLNRWIVPLEKRVDYLTLHTGKKIEIPFDMLIIFSTNLDPADLVEELIDTARFLGRPAQLTPDLIEMACDSYFVSLDPSGNPPGA